MTPTPDRIAAAIRDQRLPQTLAELFDPDQAEVATDGPQLAFHAITPHNLVLGLGAEVSCAAIACHNTAGALFVFGARDGRFGEPCRNEGFNHDVFNWVMLNWTRHHIPVTASFYPHPTLPDARVEVVLIPARGGSGLLRLHQGLGRFDAGTVLARQGAAVVAAGLPHFDGLLGTGPAPGDHAMRVALPAAPPPPWGFVGRGQELARLLQWFTGDPRRRLFLSGPAGVGKTTLALEFGRRLTAAGAAPMLPGGGRLDHVIHLAPDPSSSQAARILRLAGALDDAPGGMEDAALDARLHRLLSNSSGLIIVDDADTAAAAERLFVHVLAARGNNRLLYTSPAAHASPLDQALEVVGFSDDADYAAISAQCAERFGVPAPEAREFAMLARATDGLPGRMEAVFRARAGTDSYAQAVAGQA